MSEAVYIVLVAKACPGLFEGAVDGKGRRISAENYVRYHLPLARGRAYIHTAAVLEGAVMVWPDPRLSKRGRWWLKIRELFRQRRRE